jgi:hypothetical protein
MIRLSTDTIHIIQFRENVFITHELIHITYQFSNFHITQMTPQKT